MERVRSVYEQAVNSSAGSAELTRQTYVETLAAWELMISSAALELGVSDKDAELYLLSSQLFPNGSDGKMRTVSSWFTASVPRQRIWPSALFQSGKARRSFSPPTGRTGSMMRTTGTLCFSIWTTAMSSERAALRGEEGEEWEWPCCSMCGLRHRIFCWVVCFAFRAPQAHISQWWYMLPDFFPVVFYRAA